MGLRIIYGRAGTGKSSFCIKQIKKKIQEGVNNKLILIVPEQFTFETENRMLEEIGEKYVLKADVLSFKRLAYRVFNDCGGATRSLMKDAGKSMLIYKVLEDLSNDMQVFAGAAKQRGFIDIVSKTITEFKKYNITEAILEESYNSLEEDLKTKLKDLELIFNTFNSRLHKNHIDSEDQLTLLAQKLKDCNLYDGAEVWIDEFTTFTPQQMSVIGELLKKAKIVNITLSMEEGNTNSKDSDLFNATKSTERRLIKVLEENNLSFNGFINLNEDIPYRFKYNRELEHIERHIYSYPFKAYEGKNNSVRLYRANNSYDEMEFIAKDILRLVREKGYRYKDIAIVCRQIESYEKISSVIFNEYEIPYYIDKKMDVASNPLIILITSAIEIVTQNWTYESIFKYLKSGLTGIDFENIDKLENYVLAHGIKGKKWSEEYWQYYSSGLFKDEGLTEEDKNNLTVINEIKDLVREPLQNFYSKCKGNKTVRELATALYEFLDEDINVLERIDKSVEYFQEKGLPQKAKEYSQIVDILMEVLEQVVEVLGDEKLTLKEFIKILNIGFSKYEMGLIPIALDQITIGDITRIKSKGAKALYIVGVNDGVLPSINKDEGILSDRDRDILKGKGITLASDTRTKVFEEQFLVYTALTIAEDYLILTYPLADFEGKSLRPSIIVHRLKKILPNVKEESESFNLGVIKDKYYKISAKEPTFNELINALRRDFENKEVENYWKSVYKWFEGKEYWLEKSKRMFSGLRYTNLVETVPKEKIKRLYGGNAKKIMLSASRLEKYAQCPFAYYVQYGLKAKDRKIYEITAPDVGSFMHEIIDEFTIKINNSRIHWNELNQEKCREIVDSLVDNKINNNEGSILNSSKRYKYFTDRYKRIITKSVSIISEQMKRGNFEIFKSEFAFGNYKDSNSIKIELPTNEEVYLTGVVDRIDKLELNSNTYLRIIDYKSGNKKFELNKFYYGLQIQLIVYLDALLKNADYIVNNQAFPGAILYFRLDDPIIKTKKDLTFEEIQKEVLKQLKMDGLLLKNIQVIKSMDSGIEEGYSLVIPARIKKNGEVSDSKSIITMEQFDILRKYVNKKIIDICADMLSGNIKIEPCKNNKDIACSFCDYSHICQFDVSIQDNKYNIIRKKDEKELWDNMAKETFINLGGKE